MKNFFIIFFLMLFWLNMPAAEAATPEELQGQILKLQAQIAELQKQLTELQSKSGIWCHDFGINLKQKQEGAEVKALQIALEKAGLFKHQATGYFGPLTFQVVKLFQEKYKEEILSPQKLKSGTGFVAAATRSKLNELYGCSQVQISNLKPEQGDALIIKVKTDSHQIKGRLDSKEIKFFKWQDNWIGILGISVKEKPGKYGLTIEFPEGTFLNKQIQILERKFPTTELFVSEELKEKGFTPSKIVENITTKENLILKEILDVFTSAVYFDQPFIYPLKKIKDVGAFGNIRKSEGVAAQHLGVDLEADLGSPVFAVNDGTVSFIQELTTYGKTLIIDHGFGIFSLYLHLDEFKVSEGQKVKQGQIIALSGNTGYSISPHLHFSVKIRGETVDPLKFIELTQKELTE